MALSNLRPGITITQQRVTVAPNVQSTSLPAVFVGLNRDIVYRQKADAPGWTAGDPRIGVAFPGFVSGSGTVEAGGTNPQLAPKFYVSNSFGVAEITSSVTPQNLASDTPSFDIASGISSVFQIASGTLGCFILDTGSELTSQFKDEGADFVFAGVSIGDEIKVSGVTEYVVTGVVSDSELQARRAGKGPETIGAIEAAKMRLGPEDSNDFRVLETTSAPFIAAGGFGPNGTKVRGGDIIRIDNWETKSGSGGITFDAKGEGVGTTVGAYVITAEDRKVTLANSTLTVEAFDTTSANVGTVFFLVNEAGEEIPTFFAVGPKVSDIIPVKTFQGSGLLDNQDADTAASFVGVNYQDDVNAGTTGAFTAANGSGERTFTDASATFDDPTGTNEHHILLLGSDGIYRPVFRVVATTTSELTVTQFDSSALDDAATAVNVDYMVVPYDTNELNDEKETGGGAAVSAAGVDTDAATNTVFTDAGGDITGFIADARILECDDETIDFSDEVTLSPNGDNVAVGDLIFSTDGILLFEVIGVPKSETDGAPADSQHRLLVKLAANAGVALEATTTLSGLGFTVRQANNRSDFVVRRVISDSQLELQAAPGGINPIGDALSVQGFIYYADAADTLPVSVMAADTTVNFSYSIDKTVSGADLEGDILVTYASLRKDLTGVQQITVQDYATITGPAVPDNPIGMAAQLYFSNTNNTAFVAQVQEDSEAGWIAAFNAITTDSVYQVIPLTNDPEYIGMAQAHVIEQSTPSEKKERILWQSYRFEQNTVKASFLASDTPTVSRSSAPLGEQTVLINRDLVALGVAQGDVLQGTWSNGLISTEFEGRIQNVSPTGSATTVTMTADGNVPFDTAAMVVIDYTILDKPRSIAEQKDQVRDYPATINNRRIRNIYPDQVMIDFTDSTGDGETTGFYGGGEQQATVGAFYVGGLEAAKRTVFGPAAPLTKRGSTGILKVLDTFAAAPGFQDEIIDAGNYYIEMQAGDGSNVQAIRALTTSVADLTEAEESITPQIDTFVRRLRTQLTPFLGPEILDQRFFDIVSAQAQSVVTRTLRERQLKDLQLLEIVPSPDAADTFLMRYQAVPFFSGARAEVTITF